MSNRPYFRFSAAELTQEFKKNLNNKSNLLALQHELSHRRTPSAKRLVKQVDQHLKSFKAAERDSFSEKPVNSTPSVTIKKTLPLKEKYIQENNITLPCESNIVINCAACQQANILKPIVGITSHQCIGCGVNFDVEYKNGLVRTVFVKEIETTSPHKKNAYPYAILAIVIMIIALLVF